MRKLAIITTHPIQYNAPLFALLHQRANIKVKVFYTWGDSVNKKKYDPGFGKNIEWDIPLLQGYDFSFVTNTSTEPGSHHFKGIVNPTLNDEIKQWGATAILVFGWAFKSHLTCIRYFHGKIPVLFRGDSTLLRRQPFIKKVLRIFFLTWVYKHIDYALYVGKQNEFYFKRYGLKDKQLIYAPHAIENERFRDDSQQYEMLAQTWKDELGIKAGEMVILYAGKLEAIKDTGILIELATKLKTLAVRFLIVGNGPLEETLKSSVKDNKQFIFLDFQNQRKMPLVYRLGDLFILASKSETWGLSINEAMASGRPILVRDTCGCATDLVTDDLNGYVFNAADLDWLAHKIKFIFDNRAKLSYMGNQSLKKIESYSFVHIAEAVESVMYKIE